MSLFKMMRVRRLRSQLRCDLEALISSRYDKKAQRKFNATLKLLKAEDTP